MENLTAAEPPHPYYPIEARVIGYLANEWSMPTLVSSFLGGWGALLLLTLGLVSTVSPGLRKGDKIAILWFVLSEFTRAKVGEWVYIEQQLISVI